MKLTPRQQTLVDELNCRMLDNLTTMRIQPDTQEWVDAYETEARMRCDSLTSERECSAMDLGKPVSRKSANKVLAALLEPYRFDLNGQFAKRQNEDT